MFKWIFIVLGLLLVVAGGLTFWLPLPVGLPLLILGLPLIIRHSPHGRHLIQRMTRRYRCLNRIVERLAGSATHYRPGEKRRGS